MGNCGCNEPKTNCEPKVCGCKMQLSTLCVVNDTEQEFPCLGIKKGDRLSEVLKKLEGLCTYINDLVIPDGLNIDGTSLQLMYEDIVIDEVDISDLIKNYFESNCGFYYSSSQGMGCL
ncbi:MAG: hypothetical protein KC414_09235 [Romboutsia sp.]|nr:hypothetical protein [Romboutsia sp.]